MTLDDLERQNSGFYGFFGDFYGPSHDFLGSRKPAHEGIKERYPRESRYFSNVVQSFVKTVADKHEHVIGFRTFREH